MASSTPIPASPYVPPASLILPLLRQVDAWLRQAVLSALEQTVPCEVIIVLSPDTPESNRLILAEVKERYPALRLIERPPGTRFAAAVNLGIRSASAPRVGFLLTDDWLDPRAVELCLEHDADIVSTGLQVYKSDGKTRLRHITCDFTQAEYDRLTTLAEKAHYLCYFFLHRRAALEAIGGLDESLGDSPGIDDWDLPWTLLEDGASVALVTQRLYNCRDHEGERLTTRNKDAMLATFLRLLDKHGVEGELRERLMRQNVPSFGRSLQAVYRSREPWPTRKLREVYRSAFPIHTRRSIHERLIEPLLHLLGYKKATESRPDPFKSVWDADSLARQRLLLERVLAVAETQGVLLFLFWGTLIGHVREGKILDWDDDVDLAFFESDATSYRDLKAAFEAVGLSTFDHDDGMLKVYDAGNVVRTAFGWTWPFVDIYSYTVAAHGYEETRAEFPVPRDLILPGRTVLFEGLRVWEPQHPLKLLDRQYPGWRKREVTSVWNHRDEVRNAKTVSRSIQTDRNGKKV